LMMLAAGPGSKVTLHAKGADASAAIAELEALVQRKFDED
jgi:phosphotransferase system HPr-like phosphotransfer protein